MKESSTYQAILEEGKAEGKAEGKVEGKVEGRAEGKVEGRVEEARNLLLLLGTKRFGAPSAHTQAAIEAVGSVARLERLVQLGKSSHLV